MADTKKLIHEFPLLLSDEIGNREGRFLYSEYYTLCKGEVYLLGTNPGGHKGSGGSILDDLKEHPNRYLDKNEGSRLG